MKDSIKNRSILQILSLSGIFAAIFYVSHVIVGSLIWRNYDPVSQPISELTAETAVSRPTSDLIFSISGIFSLLFCVVMLIYFKKLIINKLFYWGVITKTVTELISVLGYKFFPLTGSWREINLQNVMHYIITGVNESGYMAVAIIMTAGMAKIKNFPNLTKYLLFFCIVFTSSAFFMVMAIILFPYYLGLVERINLYSLQLTNVVLSVWMFKTNHKEHDV